ncbi:hypothetical protein HUJ04_005386 [Dendroctonus ponderosae]|nr:hypothetical protein HUJ04_005386 [Dendroctonus ponderosae]
MSSSMIENSQRPPPGVNPQHYQQQQNECCFGFSININLSIKYHSNTNINSKMFPFNNLRFNKHPFSSSINSQQGMDMAMITVTNDKHIQEHMEVPIDTSKMSDQELQFHYFKMHDSDNNNKLDGCELIKSLIHWHVDHESGSKKEENIKIWSDEELQTNIDSLLQIYDRNYDGEITWVEFAAQNLL